VSALQENRRVLLERFAGRLFEQQPQSVLDVGCGEGGLLRMAAGRDIRACGVDVSAARVERLQQDGLDAEEASATSLPRPDRSVDWVAVRHVLHHLEEPGDALREAWRVARRGLLVAEPWNDASLPSQQAMSRVDAFLRRHENAHGHVHEPYLSAAQILAHLPADAGVGPVESLVLLRRLTVEDFDAEVEHASEGIDLSREDRSELAFLRKEVLAGRVTMSGSVLVLARKDAPADQSSST